MLRSVKYGLYGAVLAGVVSGSVAWTSVDKTVTIVVDGQARKVHTTASTVAGALASAGFHAGVHDLVAPSPDASVHQGSTIVYKRGRLLRLDVNGTRQDVWTTAPTIAEALVELGYSSGDFASVSRSRRLPLGPTDVTVRTPKLITVIVDRKTRQVSTTAATVGALLQDLNIDLGPKDTISARPSSILQDYSTLVIKRVRSAVLTIEKPLKFKTQVTNDPTMEAGRTKILKPGKNGRMRITYAVVYVDGQLVSQTQIKTVVLTAPVTQVAKVGILPAPPGTPTATPAEAQAIAKAMLPAHGWGTAEQFNCLATLWGHESGWRVTAMNPSGAYGIPQALPGSKMGPGWQTDARVQINWGLNYIGDRYGDPCNAWTIWQAHGGWY